MDIDEYEEVEKYFLNEEDFYFYTAEKYVLQKRRLQQSPYIELILATFQKECAARRELSGRLPQDSCPDRKSVV